MTCSKETDIENLIDLIKTTLDNSEFVDKYVLMRLYTNNAQTIDNERLAIYVVEGALNPLRDEESNSITACEASCILFLRYASEDLETLAKNMNEIETLILQAIQKSKYYVNSNTREIGLNEMWQEIEINFLTKI